MDANEPHPLSEAAHLPGKASSECRGVGAQEHLFKNYFYFKNSILYYFQVYDIGLDIYITYKVISLVSLVAIWHHT